MSDSTMRPRIALFGGAFSPPTIAHAAMVRCLLSMDGISAVWIVPSGHHPYDKRMLPAELRLTLCKAVFGALSRVQVLDCEINKGVAHTYTFDSVANLLALYPQHQFTWVIGSDNANDFHRWHRSEELKTLLPLTVLSRPGQPLTQTGRWCLQEPHRFEAQTIPQTSSTEVRTLMLQGEREHALALLPLQIHPFYDTIHSALTPTAA